MKLRFWTFLNIASAAGCFAVAAFGEMPAADRWFFVVAGLSCLLSELEEADGRL